VRSGSRAAALVEPASNRIIKTPHRTDAAFVCPDDGYGCIVDIGVGEGVGVGVVCARALATFAPTAATTAINAKAVNKPFMKRIPPLSEKRQVRPVRSYPRKRRFTRRPPDSFDRPLRARFGENHFHRRQARSPILDKMSLIHYF
jgi:hypothetical protein